MRQNRRGFIKNLLGTTLVLNLDQFRLPNCLESNSLKLGDHR